MRQRMYALWQGSRYEEDTVDASRPVVAAFITASRVLLAVAVRSVESAAPEITVTQHRVLVLLAARGAQRISDLALHLRVNNSNASRQCDRLERRGLVARERSKKDRRTVCVSITPAGTAVLDLVTEARRIEIAAVLEAMPDGDVEVLLAALKSFAEAAGEPADGSWPRMKTPSRQRSVSVKRRQRCAP
jgi:DNA-binding MarR family transcriptional regulator